MDKPQVTRDNVSPSEAIDAHILTYILLHRSRMHMVDVWRESRRLRDASGNVGLPVGAVRTEMSYRFEVLIQAAAEQVLRRAEVARFVEDPIRRFLREVVNDALYMISVHWIEVMDKEAKLSLTQAAVREYLRARQDAARLGRKEDSRSITLEENSSTALKEPAVKFFTDLIDGLAKYLENPGMLRDQLEAELSHQHTNLLRRKSIRLVLDVLPDEGLLERQGRSKSWLWRHTSYGDWLRTTVEISPANVRIHLRAISDAHSWISDLSGGSVSLSSLADDFMILRTSPAWPQVLAAMNRLPTEAGRSANDFIKQNPTDARIVSDYGEALNARTPLMRQCVVIAYMLAHLRPGDDLQLRSGLESLSSGFGFHVNSESLVADRIKSACSLILFGERQLPKSKEDELESRIDAILDSPENITLPPTAAFQAAAWDTWRRRFDADFSHSLRPEGRDIHELFCAAAEVEPARLLPDEHSEPGTYRWSDAFFQAFGTRSLGESFYYPFWIAVVALVRLGFADCLHRLLDALSSDPSDRDVMDSGREDADELPRKRVSDDTKDDRWFERHLRDQLHAFIAPSTDSDNSGDIETARRWIKRIVARPVPKNDTRDTPVIVLLDEDSNLRRTLRSQCARIICLPLTIIYHPVVLSQGYSLALRTLSMLLRDQQDVALLIEVASTGTPFNRRVPDFEPILEEMKWRPDYCFLCTDDSRGAADYIRLHHGRVVDASGSLDASGSVDVDQFDAAVEEALEKIQADYSKNEHLVRFVSIVGSVRRRLLPKTWIPAIQRTAARFRRDFETIWATGIVKTDDARFEWGSYWLSVPDWLRELEVCSVALLANENILFLTTNDAMVRNSDRGGDLSEPISNPHVSEPVSVSRGAENHFLVCSHLPDSVSRFRPDGERRQTVEAEVVSPVDAAFGMNNEFYVLQGEWPSTLRRFSARGEHLGHAEGAGKKAGSFESPGGIAVDADGMVYVADRGNDRVVILSSQLEFHSEIRDLRRPTALALRGDGGLYVAEIGKDVGFSGDKSDASGGRVSLITSPLRSPQIVHIADRKTIEGKRVKTLFCPIDISALPNGDFVVLASRPRPDDAQLLELLNSHDEFSVRQLERTRLYYFRRDPSLA